MKTKFLSLLSLSLILLLNACSPFAIATSTGDQATPIPEVGTPSAGGYTPVSIDSAQVEIGVGSPIPVFVNISGNLPDTCAQVEYVEQKQDGSNFIINVSTIPSTKETCLKDTLPFRMRIPLNVISLPAGKYSVEVNGVHSDFNLGSGTSAASLQTAAMPIVKNDIQVDNVNVEIGVGSPIPVHAIVSGNLPIACAQLGEIRLHRDEKTFFVQLLAYLPAQTDCSKDTIPFRAEIPLNMVNLPEGTYVVNVNGATTSFDPRTTPVQTEAVQPTTPVLGKIPAPNFEAQTYINKEVGFAMEVPVKWTISESIVGDRGSQVKFLSSPEIANLSTLPEGATRISATVYQWDPKNDLAEYVSHWKQAWTSSGQTIQEEKKSVHEGGLDTVQIVLKNSDTTVTVLLTAIGDRYLVVSGEGDMALVKEILRTVRVVSIQ